MCVFQLLRIQKMCKQETWFDYSTISFHSRFTRRTRKTRCGLSKSVHTKCRWGLINVIIDTRFCFCLQEMWIYRSILLRSMCTKRGFLSGWSYLGLASTPQCFVLLEGAHWRGSNKFRLAITRALTIAP